MNVSKLNVDVCASEVYRGFWAGALFEKIRAFLCLWRLLKMYSVDIELH